MNGHAITCALSLCSTPCSCNGANPTRPTKRVMLTIPPPMPVDDSDLIDDLANALRKAWDATSGLARYPVSDPVWTDLARVAIERVRAAS